MLTVLDGHSRAEWPVSPHVLHTRCGHVPLFWRCPDCAHSIQKFGQFFWFVRCESDPHVSANHLVYDAITSRLSCLLVFFFYAAALLGPPLPGPYLLTQRPCLDLRCQALTYVLTSSCHAPRGCFGSFRFAFLFLQTKFLASDF